MKRLYLNGSPVTSKIVGLDEIEFEQKLGDKNLSQEVSFSTELTFYGAGWQIIKSILIDPVNAFQNTITVRIWDDCCQGFLPYGFKITSNDIRFCDGDCFVSARIQVADNDAEILRNAKAKKINEPSLFTDPNQIPKFNYCVENRSNFITHAIISMSLTLLILFNIFIPALVIWAAAITVFIIFLCAFVVVILALVTALIWIITAVVNVLNFFFQIWNSLPLLPNIPLINLPNINYPNIVPPSCQNIFQNPFSITQDAVDLVKLIYDFIISCDEKHPAPLVRYYLQIGGNILGCQIQSDIFQNPNSSRYDTCILNAPENNGRSNPPTIIGENLPPWTIAEMLDKLATAINGNWFVMNGTIYLENKDYLESQQVFFDAINESADILETACYDPSPEQPYASTLIKFAEDGREEVGNDILQQYRIEVDYQQFGNTPSLEGRREINIPFAPVRVRSDEMRPLIKYDALSWWQQLGFPNVILLGRLSATQDYMLMEKGTTSVPKLIIWNRQSGINDAKVLNYGQGDFNRPWKLSWLQGGLRRYDPDYINSIAQPNGSLYDQFIVNDPRTRPYVRYRFRMRIKFTCQRFRFAIPRRRVILPIGNGRIESYTISLNSRQPYIEISGTV
jgi:hypothetical protein